MELAANKQQPSRGRGCLFYGAITALLVFIGVIAGIYFGTQKAVRYAIENYTTNAPAPIPLLRVPPGQQRAMANSLLQQFENSANKRGPDEMVVGEDELNVLVAQSAEMRAYKGHVYLQPEQNELKAFVSLPLDQFKQWKEFAYKMGGTNYSGRYLNAITYFNVLVTNGVLTVGPRKVEVAGQALPDKFLKEFPWKTLTQPINDNANIRSALQQIDAVTVQDSKVHVRFRR